MVGEFPELQGVIGGYLARAQGESDAVADAVRDHYKPVGQGDEVPTAPVTVAVSLADKLDTIASFFKAEMYPTGSKDPFALRRAMLGVINQIIETYARLDFISFSDFAGLDDGSSAWLFDFLDERLRAQQKLQGTRHDIFEAVFENTGDGDIVRLLARVNALQAFVETEEGANLLAAYKRAANILKKENWTGRKGVMSVPGSQGIAQTGEEDPLVLVEEPAIAEAVAEMAEAGRSHEAWLPEEAALRDAVDVAATRASAAIASEDFTAAMAALASLRAPIDAFFDKVTVNDPDAGLRERRLSLLARFRDAVGEVADFSKIEG